MRDTHPARSQDLVRDSINRSNQLSFEDTDVQSMTKTIAPALKALLENLIDYAGLYPPATVPLDDAIANYDRYRAGDYSWMLRWFVVGGAELERVPASLDSRLSVLSESDEKRAASMETNSVVAADRPVYCEVPLTNLERLDEVKSSKCFAKIRTGGIKPEAIPSPAGVAAFINACAQRKLAFKATAGLHHPIRKEYGLTYETDAPRAVMHGFLNVLMASAFAWNGDSDIEPVIAEMDPSAFVFDERAHWRNKSLSEAQIRDTRKNFMHAIGSCSFEEPVHDLKALGLF